VAPFLNEHQHL